MPVLHWKYIFFGASFLLLSRTLSAQATPISNLDIQPGPKCLIVIQWSVTPSADTLPIVIERTRDTQFWSKAEIIQVKPSHKYLKLEELLEDGMVYYRAGQKTSSKPIVYTPVNWIQINRGYEVYLWSDPDRDILHIKTPYYQGTITVFDTSGKQVLERPITDLITDIPATVLKSGIYFIHIKYQYGEIIEKFIKE